MKKFLIITALVTSILGSQAYANGHGEQRLQRMQQHLSLNAEQVNSMRALYQSHKAQRQTIKQQGENQLLQILTAAQANQFQTLKNERQQRRAKHGMRGGKMHHGKRGHQKRRGHHRHRAQMAPEQRVEHRATRITKHLTEKLGLTNIQANQIKGIMLQRTTQMQSLRNQHRQQVKQILNTEQLAKLEQMKQNRRARWQKHKHQ